MNILMPQLGETVAEGTVSKWHKNIGDDIKSGEILFEIETDKTSMEIPATTDGKLTKILVNEGETTSVGSIVAVIIGEGEQPPEDDIKEDTTSENINKSIESSQSDLPIKNEESFTSKKTSNVEIVIDTDAPEWFSFLNEVQTPDDNYEAFSSKNIDIKFTPLAKRLANNERVDLIKLADYFKKNNARKVNRKLLEDYISSLSVTKARSNISGKIDHVLYPEKVALNRIRRTTGQRLSESWPQVPQAFQAVEVNFSNLDKTRNELKQKHSDRDLKVSYLSFVARAISLAIKEYPLVNSCFSEKELHIASEVNLAIAVDLNYNGLIVPVLKNSDKMKLLDLNENLNDLVQRAQNNKLKQEEYFGGTYTLSNNGSMGTYMTAPIVNPPQVAIMSFDGIQKRPVIIEDSAGDTIGIRKIGVLGQSFDHRAFDGAYAASFLKEVKSIIEEFNWNSEI
jgi:pyruvate dehydrogenase E2 component (dihydrolipoamide acetyltransferase)